MDTVSKERRSENMRRIRSSGTAPEMAVRRMAHAMGYRYRLHPKGLPGRPDLAFSSRRKAVFIHGCFWHQHAAPGCGIVREPKSNQGYWAGKLERNRERDQDHERQLDEMGWRTLIIWECEIEAGLESVRERLRDFLGPARDAGPLRYPAGGEG